MRIRNKPGRITAVGAERVQKWHGRVLRPAGGVSETSPDVLRRTGVGQIQRWPSWGMGILPCPKYGRTMKENGGHTVRAKTVSADSQRTVRIPDRACGFSMECVDFSTCRVDSEQAVRILNNVCGFWTGRADFRQVVRIARGPEATGNRPFRAKNRRFRAHTAKNPP